MEILKRGNTLRYEATCPHCGCVFSFLETETRLMWIPMGTSYVLCPECRSIIDEDHFKMTTR